MRVLFTLLVGVSFIVEVSGQRVLPYINNFDDRFKIAEIEHYLLKTNKQPWGWVNNDLTNNSTSDPLDNWAVTPELDMSKGGEIDSLGYYFHTLSSYRAGDTIAVYFLEGNRDPSLATKKILLVNYLTPALFKNDSKWRLTTGIKIPTTASSGYIGFRFVSNQTGLSVRFNDLRIDVPSTTSTEWISGDQQAIQFYPNPTYGQVQFSHKVSYRLINALGSEVMHEENVKEANFINLNAGVYYLMFADNTSQKLVIE